MSEAARLPFYSCHARVVYCLPLSLSRVPSLHTLPLVHTPSAVESPASVGAHSLAFGVIFHFCIVVFGYASRAVTSANLMYMRFTQLTNVTCSWLCAAAVLVWWLRPNPEDSGNGPGNGSGGSHSDMIGGSRDNGMGMSHYHIRMGTGWAVVLAVVAAGLLANFVAQGRLHTYVRQNLNRYPQRGHAMV